MREGPLDLDGVSHDPSECHRGAQARCYPLQFVFRLLFICEEHIRNAATTGCPEVVELLTGTCVDDIEASQNGVHQRLPDAEWFTGEVKPVADERRHKGLRALEVLVSAHLGS
jgi:hypothetical protein